MRILLLLLLLVPATLGFWYRQDYESPEDRAVQPLLEAAAHIIEDSLWELVGDDVAVEALLADVRLLDLTNTSSSGCRQCVLATGAIRTLVENGNTFEDLRDEALQICYNVTENEGWRGDIVCEGAIDKWGPHVVYILNTTALTTEEACLRLNSCQPDDIEPGYYPTVSAGPQPRPYKAVPRRAVDYNDTIRVVHITDVHIEPDYDTGAATDCGLPVCCKDEWVGEGNAGPWGDYYCNLPLRTVDLYLEFLAGMDPHYVMYTGDTSPNTIWEDTQIRQNNMSQILVDKINSFLGVPAYQSIGNHDQAPTNLYYLPREDTQSLNAEMYSMWEAASGLGVEQQTTMAEGGFYTVLAQPGLRILEYNSNIQHCDNWYVLLDQEANGYGAMKQFMEDTFNLARQNGEKVIVLGHHLSGGGGNVREYSDFITDICRRNADIIVLHLFGHSHSDSFQMNTDPVTGDVYDVQISAASMTGQTNINPEAKVFYLHPDTYDVLDVDTFYLDLQNPQNNGSSPVIQLAYRATVEYNMTDFTPASIKDLVDRMETDEELLNKYLDNKDTKTGFWSPCDANCQPSFFCDIRSTSYTQEQECNRNAATARTTAKADSHW